MTHSTNTALSCTASRAKPICILQSPHWPCYEVGYERQVCYNWVQVFELWERKTEEGESKHYVRVLYNKQPLSLAKHPKGLL